MSVILNENEWALNMIKTRSLGKKPFETMRLVARRYLDAGYKPNEVRRMLDGFLLSCDPTASLPRWSNVIDAALNKAKQNHAVMIDHIDITEPEMRKIKSIESKQAQRLAFTLLCLAKYWMLVNPRADGWVNSKDSEIMSMANIKTSIRRQSAIYHQLNNLELIQFSQRVDNTNVRVCFIEPGISVLEISDFRNLGNQFNNYCGVSEYIKCSVCGLMVKKTGRQQKYCKACAAEVQLQCIAKHAKARREVKTA